MRQLTILFVTALVAAACGGSATTSTSETTLAGTTVASTAVTTTTAGDSSSIADLEAAAAALNAVIADMGVSASVDSTGALSEDGSFVDDFGVEGLPGLEVEVRALVDQDGIVWLAVFADPAILLHLWIEFDAIGDDGSVIAETSVIGSGAGPYWVEEAPNGSVIVLDPHAGVEMLRPVALGADLPIIDGFIFKSDVRVFEGGYVPAEFDDSPPAQQGSLWFTLSLADLGLPEDTEFDPRAAFYFGHMTLDPEELPPPTPLEMYLDPLARQYDVSDAIEWADAVRLGPRGVVFGLRSDF